ncbi:MAG: hypothetical protein M0Z61_11285 [Nitrospiraceae bacterium]|nr:hypothetical protein [Nitrospiraceae bacterium]MDA8103875.1 hypothetical protein [Nitrospiraceae bacterium]
MKININVKRRFKINGKEYNSIEEMPDDVRAAFEEAMDSQAGAEHTVKSETTKTMIVFNGTEYDNADTMPSDVRQLYERVLKAAESGTSPSGIDMAQISGDILRETQARGPRLPGDVRRPAEADSSFSSRALILSIALVALLLLFYYLFRSR